MVYSLIYGHKVQGISCLTNCGEKTDSAGTIDSSQSLNRYAYVEGNPVSYLDPFGLEKWIYDDLHNGVAELKRYVSITGGFETAYEKLVGERTIVFCDGSTYAFGACVLTLGGVISIGNFVANTALTWFDVGVYVNEWICAASEGDADRMIEINYKIAETAALYTIDTCFFIVDLYYTGGVSSTVFTVINEFAM